MKKSIIALFFFFGILCQLGIGQVHKVLFLSPGHFEPLYEGDVNYYRGGADEGLYILPGSTTRYFIAPINLPETAKIVGVTLFYKDNDAETIGMWVNRVKMYSATGEVNTILDWWYTPGTSSDRRLTKVSSVDWKYNMILNGPCTYNLVLYFTTDSAGTDLVFYGAKIFYSLD